MNHIGATVATNNNQNPLEDGNFLSEGITLIDRDIDSHRKRVAVTQLAINQREGIQIHGNGDRFSDLSKSRCDSRCG